MAGTIGAIFNGALQLGSAVGIAAVSSIETSVEAKLGDSSSYAGRAAAFWFLLGIICLETISLLVFYRVESEHRSHHDEPEHGEVEIETKNSKYQNLTVEAVELSGSAVGSPEEIRKRVEEIPREEAAQVY